MKIRIWAILNHLFGSSSSSSGDDSHGKFNLITLLAFTFTVDSSIPSCLTFVFQSVILVNSFGEENTIELVLKTCLEKRPLY